MGSKSGGGGSGQGFNPIEFAQAQVEAQHNLDMRKRADQAAQARTFASENPVSDDFRNDIRAQVDDLTNFRVDRLNQELANITGDINARQSGRGTGGENLISDARALAEQSIADIRNSGERLFNNRINDADAFRNEAQRNIRGGTSFENALSRFKEDQTNANSAFEQALSNAKSSGDKNRAFSNFENARRTAAARFSESPDLSPLGAAVLSNDNQSEAPNPTNTSQSFQPAVI